MLGQAEGKATKATVDDVKEAELLGFTIKEGAAALAPAKVPLLAAVIAVVHTRLCSAITLARRRSERKKGNEFAECGASSDKCKHHHACLAGCICALECNTEQQQRHDSK